ncbi:MAG: orotidine 5'-phosphate decarboxylase / HUMPS family protein, partial [Myxococcaceae bacterium]
MSEKAREKLAFAADLPLADATALYRDIAPHVGWAKVGLSLFVEHGPAAVQAFLSLGARVFLDLKLHDIPNTVELAAGRAAALGASLLTVHASGGAAMVQAACRGAREGAARKGLPPPRVLAVTVLTS